MTGRRLKFHLLSAVAGLAGLFLFAWVAPFSDVQGEETNKAHEEAPATSLVKRPVPEKPPALSIPPLRRQPVAMAFADAGRRLLVANRRSGTISAIDTETQALLAEHSVGGQLSDLATSAADPRYFLAIDEAGHRLLLLEHALDENSKLSAVASLRVPPFPVSISQTTNGQRVFVASLWSRRLTVVKVESSAGGAGVAEKTTPTWAIERTIVLPFAPRMQVWIPRGERLLVADSFGGKVALVDPERGNVESVRVLPAHNIRGLTLHPNGAELLVSHQTLSRYARTTFEDIHWGTLITNVVHALSIDKVLDPQGDLLSGSRTFRLGDVGRAAGDPGGIAATVDRRIVVACSGVDEVAVIEEGHPGQKRLETGSRPSIVALHPGGIPLVYVVNTLEDSISVIDLSAGTPRASIAKISLGPRPALTPADEGERLFYNARLSHDGWMSCQSCHTDGHSNGLLNDNRGDGSFDAPKRVLSLLGVAGTKPLAWTGGTPDLARQIRKSVETTMHGPGFAGEISDDQVAALATYLRTLPPPPPLGRLTSGASAEKIERGKLAFERLDCQRCHTPPTYTSEETYDVGLTDEVGNRRFNPPSLRGVSQRDALFHDNRASSLEEVFAKHRHQIPDEMPAGVVADLVEFLRTL